MGVARPLRLQFPVLMTVPPGTALSGAEAGVTKATYHQHRCAGRTAARCARARRIAEGIQA